MAENIGPKIGLQGEKEFKKEITNVTTATKAYKAEVDALTSSFDKSTTAQEKVKKKREALTTAIEKQKAKVDQLKDAIDKAESSGSASENTINKAKTALANAETQLNNMQNELNDLPSSLTVVGQQWENVGSKITSVGDKIAGFGDSWTKNVTGPIAATATAAVAAFSSLDKGYDTIINKTGATGDALTDLKEQATDIYTSMNVSMDEVGAAIGEVNTRFGLAGDEAETAARAFLEFAHVNGTDVSNSVDVVQNALAAFNMDVSDAGTLLDVLTHTGQATGASVDKMATTVVQNATAFQQMGMDIYEAVAFMGQFETAGADSESVLSGLKRALKSATEEGIPFDQALADLESTILDGTDGMDGLSAAYDLFGKSGAAVYQAVSNGQISFTDFAASADILDSSLGAVSNTYEATIDPIDEFKIAMNNAKVAGASVGSSLLTMVTPAIEKLSEIIGNVTEWWNGLDETQQKNIATIAGIVAVVGPVLAIGGRVVSTIGTIVSGVGTAITVIGTIGPIITGTVLPAILPALPIILGIAAAIAAVILIVKNWGAITEWFSNAWDTATTWVSEKATAIKEGISSAWDNVKTKTSETWNNIKSSVAANGGGIQGILATAAQGYVSLWSGAFTSIDNLTGGKLSAALSTVQSKLESIKSAFTDKLNAAKTAVQTAIDKIKSIFNFNWSLPTLKLPHFSITGSFSLNPPSVPHLSIEWYKKAYGQPMMFTSPTVLATAGGLKGFGDGSGAEIVIGQSMMYSMIRDAVSDSGASTYNNDIDIVVNAAPGQSAEEIAEMVSLKINQAVYARRAVFA